MHCIRYETWLASKILDNEQFMHQLPHMTRLVSSVEIRMEIEMRLGKFWRFHVVFGRGLVEMRFKTHE